MNFNEAVDHLAFNFIPLNKRRVRVCWECQYLQKEGHNHACSVGNAIAVIHDERSSLRDLLIRLHDEAPPNSDSRKWIMEKLKMP